MHLGLLVNTGSGWVPSQAIGSGRVSSICSGRVFFWCGSGRVPLHRFGSGASPRVESGVISPPARASVPIRLLVLHMLLSDPSSCLRSDPSSLIRSDPSSVSVAFLFATFPKCWVPIRSDSLLSSTYLIRAPYPIRTLHYFLKLFQQVVTPFDDVFDHSNY